VTGKVDFTVESWLYTLASSRVILSHQRSRYSPTAMEERVHYTYPESCTYISSVIVCGREGGVAAPALSLNPHLKTV